MSTIIVLARILVCFAVSCAPLLLYIRASRKPENGMLLIFPVFGAIPAILGALCVFAPLETYLDAQALGYLKNVAIPLSGSLLIVLFLLVRCLVSGHFFTQFQRIFASGLKETWPVLLWSILGLVWGVCWRISDGIVSFGRHSVHALAHTLGA